ncbi:hypothetical protein BC827DRAFT_1269949 [Russula dissimulans]|nr:hypothetical protein BC827DRAFT_1269949 [Russula dissimulans]
MPSSRDKRQSAHTFDVDSGSDHNSNSEDTHEDASGPHQNQTPSGHPRPSKRPRNNERPTDRSNTQDAQDRSHPSLDREAVQAPGSRRQNIYAAISLAINDNHKKPKEEMDGAIADMYCAARWLPQHLGPFISIRSTFLNGAHLEIVPDPLSNQPITDQDQAVLVLYHKLLKAVLGLKEQVIWTYEY